jgi:hypothetical protein
MALTATVMVVVAAAATAAAAIVVVMVVIVVMIMMVMLLMLMLLVPLLVPLLPLTFYRIPSECRLQFLRDISHTCMQAARVPFTELPSGMAPPCRHGS